MNRRNCLSLSYLFAGWLLAIDVVAVPAPEVSGHIAAQGRWFPEQPLDSRQAGSTVSLAVQPEFYWQWAQGRQRFTLELFARLDRRDAQRSHADVREALWLKVDGDDEWAIGISKVFWGVTESVHLVDIVNQTDLVENPDGEQKLGQPMLRYSSRREWGVLDLFLLPGFRERTFPGVQGRLRFLPSVDVDRAIYESSAGRRHLDIAARWSHYRGDWDFGVSGFRGTSRDPDFIPALNDRGEPVLLPYYPLISQLGLDVQATKGDWLWKLESIYRWGQGDGGYLAAVGGFEYTLVGFAETALDLGLLLEYQYDQRGIGSASPFQNDLFAGMRLTFNDTQSTALLAGLVQDLDSDGRLFNLEASRRLGAAWLLQVQARLWSSTDAADPFHGFRNDDYIEVDLARYF